MSLISRYSLLVSSFTTDVLVRPALRVNTLKISSDVLVKRLEAKGVLLERIPFLPHGFWYDSSFSLGSTSEYLQGYYYLQEAASQIPPLVLLSGFPDGFSNPLILDMAAAPGSKTTQIAQLTGDSVPVVALDSDAYRLAALRNNLERLGVRSVVSYKKDSRFVFDLKSSFSHILLDAPCSGNFCIEKDFFSIRSVDDFKRNARRQKELLKAAYRVLRPGGVLVYSTCSLEPEEDELVIDWFLRKFPDMSLVPHGLPINAPALTSVFGNPLNPSLSSAVRLWPHLFQTQGFFIAKLVKKVGAVNNSGTNNGESENMVLG